MSFFNTIIVSIVRLLPKPVVGFFSRKYIAGETLDDAVRVVKELNSNGIFATLDVLGESIKNKEEAAEAKSKHLKFLILYVRISLMQIFPLNRPRWDWLLMKILHMKG